MSQMVSITSGVKNSFFFFVFLLTKAIEFFGYLDNTDVILLLGLT